MKFPNNTKRKTNRFFLLFCLLLCLSCVGFGQSNSEDAVINKFIESQEKANNADEYKEARKVIKGDLDKDGKTDLAVFYTLEGFGGGNLYLQYLAIFTNANGKFRYLTYKPIGGKDSRSINSETAVISNGRIKVNTLAYSRTDASCCPSKKGSAQFILDKGKIKEIK